ncbi:MAG TPA: S-adenosylmethionine:tRNA ribosyltransferase-isomerase [Puia sp.]|nr:S-adenosylmethionine:tRNA ribosyltransferase-isomerase [Puia sp.]
MNPKDISILDFTYQLPEEKIAKYPLAERDASKLLIYKEGKIAEDIYKNISSHIPENSLLIFNNTKVVEARIIFQKATGGLIEIFCLEPHEQHGDIASALQQQDKVVWKCLIGGASKWKHGQILEKKIIHNNHEIIIYASFIKKEDDYFLIELSWKPEKFCFAEILHFAGIIPLPPYIKRETEISDIERYQTIYAKNDGSVAAPTAGLHFTDSIFEKLTEKHIQKTEVTLHVGAGTFMPVKSETLAEHHMHFEFIDVELLTIRLLIKNLDNHIIPVGTTSLRTIESLYWLGLKTILNPDITSENLIIHQWDAYELNSKNIDGKKSLQSLSGWMEKNNLEKLITRTQLLIAPGSQFKIIKALITNFHQPQSTLLLLVAALIGEDWRKVYDYAMNNEFRFLSYGDGCILFKNEK